MHACDVAPQLTRRRGAEGYQCDRRSCGAQDMWRGIRYNIKPSQAKAKQARAGQMSHSQLWPIKRSLNVTVASGLVCEQNLMTWRMHLDMSILYYIDIYIIYIYNIYIWFIWQYVSMPARGIFRPYRTPGHIINIKWRTKPR